MIVKIQFQLPQESKEYSEAINGAKYKSALNSTLLALDEILKEEEISIEKHDLAKKLKSNILEYLNGIV